MEETINFFNEQKHVFTLLHVFSVIVGMGSALVSDILFNVYIKDKKINIHEDRTLNTLSKIIWFSLFFIFMSGIALFLSDPVKYSHSVKFLIKMTIVTVVIINGYMFQRIVHPALRKINFSDTNIHHKYVKLRKLSFAFGAISLTSWLLAFILGMLKSIPISYTIALLGYITILLGGVLFSQIVEYRLTHKGK